MMRRSMRWIAVLALAALLVGCFAILPGSDGNLSIELELPPQAKAPETLPVIIFVGNADMEDEIRELLWLIDKDADSGLSDEEDNRLEDVARDVVERGLVTFGGDPFVDAAIPAPSSGDQGYFDLKGVPAGRKYFVKVFVFAEGTDISDIEDSAENVLYENRLFAPEDYITAYKDWTQFQTPIEVERGKITPVTITLVDEL